MDGIDRLQVLGIRNSAVQKLCVATDDHQYTPTP
jgi:hypothetical protein